MKKIAISILILSFSVASVFCCCLTGTAHAEAFYRTEHGKIDENRCCPDKTKNEDSENNRECKCEKVAEILTIKGFVFSKGLVSLGRVLDKFLPFSRNISVPGQEFVKNYFLWSSQPISKSDIPLYLQDSVLRL